jgi:sirohydrochlorin cobaltochelatase
MKNIKSKIWTLAFMIIVALVLGACQTNSAPEVAPVSCPTAAVPASSATDETQTTTSSEAAVNQDTNKKALLVVSFGTSYADTREKTIGASEKALAAAFPDYDLKRAFTAQTIIDILKSRDGIETDNVAGAIEKLYKEGYGEVLVQPLHVINGEEYDGLLSDLAPYSKKFAKLIIGKPLLNGFEDYKAMVAAVSPSMPELGEHDAVVFMGHGTPHFANSAYGLMDYTFKANGYPHVYVGTVEGYPDLESVMHFLKADGIEKVTLMPLMIVAGDHAQNDMAGDEDSSWKVILKSAGYEVDTRLVGLGEMDGIHQMYIQHAQEALKGEVKE